MVGKMSEQEPDNGDIPLLKDMVIPPTQTTATEEMADASLDEQVIAAPPPSTWQKERNSEIPLLKDVVIATTQTTVPAEVAAAPQPSLLSSTLQEEVDAIIAQARADFDTAIAKALSEMQQRIEQELSELHIQLTSDN